MGQTNSRQRASQPSTAPQDHPRSPPATEASTSRFDQSTIEPTAPASKRSRRTSLRRSIFGLIPSSSSSSSTRSRKDNSSSNSDSSQSLRKRWRSSRRFSKAPAHLTDLAESTQPPGAPDSDREVVEESLETGISEISSGTHSLSQAGPSTSSALSQSSTPGNDKPPKQSGSTASRIDSQPSVPASVVPEPALGVSTHPTTEEIRREVAEFLNVHAEESGVNPNDSENVTSTGPREANTAAGDANVSPQTSPQQFPPPGTLVVVQGVVNTTDTPHTAAPQNTAVSGVSQPTITPPRSSTAFPSPPSIPSVRRRASSVTTPHPSSRMLSLEEPHSSRNRLSSLIRNGRGPSEGSLHAHTASAPDASLLSSLSASDGSSSSTDSTPSTTASNTQESSSNENTNASRGLSPGSIDVLGTLLRYVHMTDL